MTLQLGSKEHFSSKLKAIVLFNCNNAVDNASPSKKMTFFVGKQSVRQRLFVTSAFVIVCVFLYLFLKNMDHLSFVSVPKNLLQGTLIHALNFFNDTEQAEVIDFVNTTLDFKSNDTETSIIKISEYSGTNCCCSDSYWDTLVDSDVLTGTQIMDYFMWTNRSSCRLAHDFGGQILGNPSGKDGQKAVCIDPQVAPKPEECLVYSFGINSEWSFDEEMEQYGCQVFAFDPSMKMEPHDHTPGIHFYNWGLSDRDEIETRWNGENGTRWQMYSLSSVYNILSTRHGFKIIDYLKMDIEGSEWKVLPDIIKTGQLSKVRQLGLEIHLPDYPVDGFRNLVKLLRAFESTGMVRFDSKYNPWYIRNFTHIQLWKKPAGYEIAWYNSKLLHPGT